MNLKDPLAACLFALPLVLTGCGGDSANGSPTDASRPTGSAPAANQGNRGIPPGYAQTMAVHESPQAVTLAFWQHVARGEFEAACQLFPPGVAQMVVCIREVQKTWSAQSRAKMKAPVVDADKIQIDGDIAHVPWNAMHDEGQSPREAGDDTKPFYYSTDCVRIGGQWWVDPNSF